MPYDSAISLLGINSEELKIVTYANTCTPVFTATLFTIAPTWRQLKCPSTD